MIKSLLSILSNLLQLFMWWKKKQADPVTQIENERAQFQKAVADGDENSVNATLADDLARLRDKQATGNPDSK